MAESAVRPGEHPFRLDGKLALVTGAGRGIGRAIALALAGAGAELLLNSRTPAELEAVGGGDRRGGGRARPLPFDVTDSAAARDAIAGAARGSTSSSTMPGSTGRSRFSRSTRRPSTG